MYLSRDTCLTRDSSIFFFLAIFFLIKTLNLFISLYLLRSCCSKTEQFFPNAKCHQILKYFRLLHLMNQNIVDLKYRFSKNSFNNFRIFWKFILEYIFIVYKILPFTKFINPSTRSFKV